MIVLGDAKINYYTNMQNYCLKNSLLQYPITFFVFTEIMKKDLKTSQPIKQRYFMAESFIMKKIIRIFYLLKMVKFIILIINAF